MKETDFRWTPRSLYKEIRRRTGITARFYDPVPRNSKRDALKRPWKSIRSVYVNPPFSQSKLFAEKLLDELRVNNISSAILILPWYQVEDVDHRVTSAPKWFKEWYAKAPVVKWWATEHAFIHPTKGQYDDTFKVYVFYLVK